MSDHFWGHIGWTRKLNQTVTDASHTAVTARNIGEGWPRGTTGNGSQVGCFSK